MIEIEGPDGVIYEFPEGTPEQVMREALAREYAGWSQPEQQPPMSPEMQAGLAELSAMTRNPPPKEQTWGEWAYGNIVGNPNDGVTNGGEALASWLNRAGEAMTFGLVGDEAAAAADALIGRGTYDDRLTRYRKQEEDLGTWGRMSADLAGGAIPALTGVGALGAATTLPGRMAVGAGMGLGAGATQGFMEGEGGFRNRATSGIIGGGIGGIIGGGVPLVAEFGRSLVGGARNMLRDRAIGREVGGALGVSPKTGRVVTELVGADDPQAMADALRMAGPGAMLGDASGRMVGALDAAMQSPVPGADVARRRINERAGAAFAEIMDALNPEQAPQVGVRGAQDAIRTGTAAARGSAYDAAYAAPIDYASDQGQKLLGLQSRLPAKAIAYANELMKLRGEKSGQIVASIADDGSVALTNPPDVRQWDYIKQALDQLAESGDGAGALGGQTRMGAAYQGLAKEVRDTVADLVPEYRTALDTASDAIARRKAVEFGADLLSTRTTTEDALATIKDATAPEIEAMRTGVRAQLAEAFGNINAVPSDRSVDARQAAAAVKKFTSPNAQAKMAALFGSDWPAIREQIDRAAAAVGLRADLAGNSRTFGRTAANEAIQEIVKPGALQSAAPLRALGDLVSGAMGASPEAIRRSGAAVRSELADVLTRQGGAPQVAIDAVTRALAQNPALLNAGGNTAVGFALGGYGAIPALLMEMSRGRPQ